MVLAGRFSSTEIYMRLVLLAILALSLAGCATQNRYQWGGYEDMLYQGYKDPNKMEVLRTSLETHISSMEQSKQKVAPGLYAELGTLYLQQGNTAKAIDLYSKERDAWPESKGLMNAMIANVSRRNQTAMEKKL